MSLLYSNVRPQKKKRNEMQIPLKNRGKTRQTYGNLMDEASKSFFLVPFLPYDLGLFFLLLLSDYLPRIA